MCIRDRSSVEREAGKATLRARELEHRLGLTRQVPCAGMDLQGRCQLLGDSRAARPMIAGAQEQLARLAREQARLRKEIEQAHRAGQAMGETRHASLRAQWLVERADQRVRALSVWAARTGEMAQAGNTLASAEGELALLCPRDTSPGLAGDLARKQEEQAEQAERAQIGFNRRQIADELQRQSEQLRSGLDRLDSVLAQLPPPFDHQGLADSIQDLAQAQTRAGSTDEALARASADDLQWHLLLAMSAGIAERWELVQRRIVHVESELGGWNLLARCLSNDGLIALAIDDAGPALSSLANDLLLACYGSRFTVSIHTLVENGKGESREGFDVIVHDGESGQCKSVALMSGGERVWINECLTRAVALYLAQSSGNRYATLFSDEADGPLDAERKRMFMAMKREVLRLGGYSREFFVSQTPELTAMADTVIDMDAMVNADAALA